MTDGNPAAQVGLRYIPELSASTRLSDTWELSGEAAVDANLYRWIDSADDISGEESVDWYRLWLRLSSPQFETRVGLQKISFGSASLLRPLMWFDTLDPRDPLQLTDGVYGVLNRYTFQNNVNIWLWGLYDNDELRGWDTLPSDNHTPEWGGRIQTPAGPGEAGLSVHHRQVDPDATPFGAAYPGQGEFAEDRIGLDGKWDVGVGLWFEGVMTRQALDHPLARYRKQLTVGSDYTFDVGSGLHLLGEQYVSHTTDELAGLGDYYPITAFSCDYPLSLFDTLAAYTYYDWDGNTWSPSLEWRRIYDRWQINVSVFHTIGESQADLYGNSAAMSGTGVRLMLIFNH
ncbi:MAG: hypothetical protein PHO37_04630 [Kiritimatiellae bacterium]|nr:hypothetical protein [Kiritimatiellia bacterium]